MTLTSLFTPRARLGLVVACLATLAACASVPPPTDLMARAQDQLNAAHQAKASIYAPVDLDFAKQRFAAAQAAMQAKKYKDARDMANESLADGQLAQTRAELAALRKAIRAQKAENTRLKQQLLQPAPASSAGAADDNNGVPSQMTLPAAPAVPASAASTGDVQ